MPKFNLELFETLILNFAYIHSKRKKYVYCLSEMLICLSKQSKFATNSPISFIFNVWSRDMSCDHI